jgi:hypothetical protein
MAETSDTVPAHAEAVRRECFGGRWSASMAFPRTPFNAW